MDTDVETPRLWNLLSPVGVKPEVESGGVQSATGASLLRLAMLSNHKPNASRLQELLVERISEARPDIEVRFYEKQNSSVGAPEPLLAQIAADCGLAINGTGD